MRRVYKEVTAHPVESGWGIFLDGKPLRTPAKRELAVPSERLAQALAGVSLTRSARSA